MQHGKEKLPARRVRGPCGAGAGCTPRENIQQIIIQLCGVVRSKRVTDRRNYVYFVEYELLFIVISRKLCSLLSSTHGVSGNVIQKVKRKKEEMKIKSNYQK